MNFLFFILLSLTAIAKTEPTLKELSDKVLDLDYREEFRKDNNKNGHFGWYETNRLKGYLKMYEATSDTVYLDDFINLGDYLLSRNDKALNIRDTHRRRVVFGWSSTKYSKKKKRYTWAVQSGIFAEIYLMFSNLVLKENLDEYKEKALCYIDVGERLLAEIEGDWSKKHKFYVFKTGAHKTYYVLPYNQGLAVGRAYLELNKIPEDRVSISKKDLKKKIKRIGTYFKKALTYNRLNDSYLWKYAPGAYFEDASHAVEDINFAIKAYKQGFIFNEKDMKRFHNTYLQTFSKKRFERFIDGTSRKIDNFKSLTCLEWLSLYEFSDNPVSFVEKCESVVKKTIYNERRLRRLSYNHYVRIPSAMPLLFFVKTKLGILQN